MRLIHFKAKRHNPRRHKARKHSRKRHNPASLKKLLSPSAFIGTVSVVGGFIVGNKVTKMISGFLPASQPGLQKFVGAATFILGAFAASKVRNETARKAASGVAASGVYALIAANIPSLVAGETISMNGNSVELVGNDSVYAGETISVAGDMTELVGEDEAEQVYG